MPSMIEAERQVKIEYAVNYKPNGTPESQGIRKGRHALFLTQEDGEGDAYQEALASAEKCQKWFNETTSVETIEGKEHFKTVVKEIVDVWIEEYHDGSLVKKSAPIPYKKKEIPAEDTAKFEGSFLGILREILQEEYSYTKAASENMLTKHSGLVMAGLLGGMSLRGIKATAKQIHDAEALRSSDECEAESSGTESELGTSLSMAEPGEAKKSRRKNSTESSQADQLALVKG